VRRMRAMNIEVLYEDADLLAVNKPAGVLLAH
jgi:23S rRNA-/tRNA-specific pseudouridylate synthase